jgi:hypothetical protein
MLPEEYKQLIHKDTQTDTQITSAANNFKLSLNNQNFQEINSRGSLAWFGRQTHNLENA